MSTTLPQIEAQPKTSALHALLTTAAFAPLPDLGWLRVNGSDRVRWLNGMVTNSISALKPGEGCYNFVLNAQGRIQADLTAFMLEDSILVQTASPGTLATLLDRFIIMDDVELEVLESGNVDRQSFAETALSGAPVPVTLTGLLIAGPDARTIVMNLGTANQQATPCSTPPSSLPQTLNLKQTAYASSPVMLIQAHSPLVPRFEIWSDPATIAAIVAELHTSAAILASPSDLHHLRLLEGTPLYGTDIRNSDTAKDLPQETAQSGVESRALHFAKGCYLGQEIVERIRSRGNVHRTFTGFVLAGTLPTAGTALTGPDGKTVGEFTSVASVELPQGPVQLALGYIRREALDRALPLHYPGGQATPLTFPFTAALSQTLNLHPNNTTQE